MRVCIVYDCLFPFTIGGAERWYRNLAEKLASQGHQVTYLTLMQWEAADPPRVPGVTVVPVGPAMSLYRREGRRRLTPPLRFGLGVLLHLLRHGGRYDVVHTASFPFFSMLAIGLIRPLGGFRVICDWHEVWSRSYWREYLGGLGGEIGWLVQRLCARVPQRAHAFSRLHAERLGSLGLRGPVGLLTGEYEGNLTAPYPVAPAEPPIVVYAGRLIPEKRVTLLVDAIDIARRSIPQLQATIFGKGPEWDSVRERIDELALQDVVSLPGFVSSQDVNAAMARALCVVQPSSREGYGMIVVEASAAGVPALVINGEDNAAVELIETGHNGFIVQSPDPRALAEGIVGCWRAGDALRTATRAWYARNAERLSLTHSLNEVIDGYNVG
jgi:glycosyltransferase involved in cell wall biosynthesis